MEEAAANGLLDEGGADAVDGQAGSLPRLGKDGLLVDATFGRRIRTLARSGPLHQLTRNAAHQDGDWSCYDLLALQLAAIDYVMIRMGLATGTTREALTGALADLAAAAAPNRDAAEHRRVATVVIDWLLNDNAPRVIPYTDFSVTTHAVAVTGSGGAGAAQQTTTPMAYLVEQYGVGPLGDGTAMLRVPDEAINLLLGAIDLELEDERAALELVLNRAIDRGHFDEAVRVGRRALGLTIRYMERIREELERALIDIRGVDLDRVITELLQPAIAHLDDRLYEDSNLRDRVLDVLGEATDAKVVRASRELLELIEQSTGRNRGLQEFLQQTPDILLDEQRRQVLAPAQTVQAVDLSRELLRPLLAGTLAQGWAPAAAFFTPVIGVARLPRFSVSGLVELLLASPAEQTTPQVEDESPPLVYGESGERFSAAVWQAVAVALGKVGDGRLLSAVLRDARGAARRTGVSERDAAVLAALCVLGRFAPDHVVPAGPAPAADESPGGSPGGRTAGSGRARADAARGVPTAVPAADAASVLGGRGGEDDADAAAEVARLQVHAALARLVAVPTGATLTGDPDVAATELLVQPASSVLDSSAASREDVEEDLEEMPA